MYVQCTIYVRSDSGMELFRLGEELEVIVLSVGLPAN